MRSGRVEISAARPALVRLIAIKANEVRDHSITPRGRGLDSLISMFENATRKKSPGDDAQKHPYVSEGDGLTARTSSSSLGLRLDHCAWL